MNGYPQFNGWRATRSLGVGKTGETFEISRSDGFGTSETGALKRIHVPTEEDYEAQQEQRAQLEEVAQALRAADALSEHPNILPWRDHEIRTAEDGDGWVSSDLMAARKAREPMRPKPLIPTLMLIEIPPK